MKKYLYILRNEYTAYLLCEENKIKYFKEEKSLEEVEKILKDKVECENINFTSSKEVKCFGKDYKVILVDILNMKGIKDIESIKFLNNLDSINFDYKDLKLIGTYCNYNKEFNKISDNRLNKDERSMVLKNMIISFIISLLSTLFIFNGKEFNYFGINIPMIIGLIAIMGVYYAGKTEKINLFSIYFLAISILLSGTFGIYTNLTFRIINLCIIPVTMCLGLYSISTSKEKLNCQNLIFNGLYNLKESFLNCRSINLFFKILKTSYIKNKGKKKNEKIRGIEKGIIISIPLLIILVMLLSAADEKFADILNKLKDINLRFILNFNISGLLCFAGLMLLIFYTITSSFDNLKFGFIKVKKIERQKIDKNMVNTILILVNSLYVFFTYVQIKYLYMKKGFENFTAAMYSDYARSGFFQLIVVVILNIIIILFFKNRVEDSRLTLVLNTIMTVVSINMAITSLYKMGLYIGKYGMTRLRFMSSFFIVFIILMLIVIVLSLWRKVDILKLGIIVGSIIYVIMNYSNMDKIIANYNLNEEYVERDNRYITSLSLDAYDEILKGYNEGKIDEELFDKYISKKKELKHWYEFNYYRNR